MADRTGIEWTDSTWNPLRGCSRVSEGCKHCYAEGQAARFSGPGMPYEGVAKRVTRPDGRSEARWTGKVVFAGDMVLTQPLRWKRPRRIFVNSMSDLFHESVPDEWIDRIFAVMALCPQHTFQVLTKRPERMRAYLTRKHRNPQGWPAEDYDVQTCIELSLGGLLGGKKLPNGRPDVGSYLKSDRPSRYAEAGRRLREEWPLPNVWLGTSVEDQVTADTRIPYLLDTPAVVRFISAEPLLGPVDLTNLTRPMKVGEHVFDALSCDVDPEDDEWQGATLDWVIVGGESGRGARPMHPDWARSLRDQCAAVGVAFLFKQWGEWLDADQFAEWALTNDAAQIWRDGRRWRPARPLNFADAAWLAELLGHPYEHQSDGRTGYRLGKHRSGRYLDGVTHDGYPA